MSGLTISLDDVAELGAGLVRPECVLCTAAGNVYTSDWRGGIACTRSDGGHVLIGRPATTETPPFKPNGFALRRDGSFLFANLGADGGVWQLARDGTITPFLLEVDGLALPQCNFVLVDSADRVWISVSHGRRPREPRADLADGVLVLADGRGARVAADGFAWTNECRVDATGRFLYVNETFGRRLTRFRLGPDGTLAGRETVATFGAGTFPDGLAADAEGGMWVTSVVSNRVIRVMPDGAAHVVLEDLEPEHVARVERAFAARQLTLDMIHESRARKLRNVSSLAFGGPDLRTAYLGCLSGDRLATFRSPVAGAPPAHWTWEG
jgi:sugar lactone lactonase YvrE